MEIYANNYAITAVTSRVEAAAERARGLRAASSPRTTSRGRRANRQKILAEWSKRYDSKSAPK